MYPSLASGSSRLTFHGKLGNATGVCEKTTPPEKRALGKISFNNIKSGAGEEFMLLFCRAKVSPKRSVVFL